MNEDLENQFNYAKRFVPTLEIEILHRKLIVKIKDRETLILEGSDTLNQSSALMYISGIIIAHENL